MNLVTNGQLCRTVNCMLYSKRTKFLDRKRRRFFDLKDREEPEYFSASEPNPVADIEKRIEESKSKLQWRKPHTQQPGLMASGLRFLAPERTRYFMELIQRPLDKNSIAKTLEYKAYELQAVDQRYIPDRHRILGNDLATAHFLIARGGQVRFTRSKEWIKKNEHDEYNLPRVYDAEYYIDAIKCEGVDLLYEGLENLRRLNYLIYLSFRNHKRFDDWFLDRVCGEQFEQLKILDVSGTSVTANGLIAVPKLRSLGALVIDKSDRSIEFQLACSLLEEAMPDLKILDSKDVHDDPTTSILPTSKTQDATQTN